MMGVGICVFGCEVHGLVGEAGGGMETGWGEKENDKGREKKKGGSVEGERTWGNGVGEGERARKERGVAKL